MIDIKHTYYVFHYRDEEIVGAEPEYHVKYHQFIDKMCYELSTIYGMSDCYDSIVIDEVVSLNRPIHYLGWQPGNLYEFADKETGELVYSCRRPDPNH